MTTEEKQQNGKRRKFSASDDCTTQPTSCLVKGIRSVTDPVHGSIELPGIVWRIIDTPEFQRLRGLKQIGAAYMIYPGAHHSRFEHSIGVSYLGMKWVKSLREKQPELGITDQEILCVTVAGLCHDLGHGPYSHLYDELIQHEFPDSKWKHEKASAMIVDRLMMLYPEIKAAFSTKDILFIKELILGSKIEGGIAARKGCPKNKLFLYEIINNERCGLDVDKLDYMLRDGYYCGVSTICRESVERLCQMMRAYPEESDPTTVPLCLPDKSVQSAFFEVFQMRVRLHQSVYQQQKVKACELMFSDIFKYGSKGLVFTTESGEKVNLLETYKHMELYTQIGDSVVDMIKFSTDPQVSKAQQLIKRLQTRDLYKCCGRVNCPPHLLNERPAARDTIILHELLEILNNEEVVLEMSPPESTKSVDSKANSKVFSDEDLIVESMRVHHGMGGENPLNSMLFYKKGSKIARRLNEMKYGQAMLPPEFTAISIRVFSRESVNTARITAAFQAWSKIKKLPTPIYSQDVDPSTPPSSSSFSALHVFSEEMAKEALEQEHFM